MCNLTFILFIFFVQLFVAAVETLNERHLRLTQIDIIKVKCLFLYVNDIENYKKYI